MANNLLSYKIGAVGIETTAMPAALRLHLSCTYELNTYVSTLTFMLTVTTLMCGYIAALHFFPTMFTIVGYHVGRLIGMLIFDN